MPDEEVKDDEWDKWDNSLPPAIRNRQRLAASTSVPENRMGWWVIIVDDLSEEPSIIEATCFEQVAEIISGLRVTARAVPLYGCLLREAAAAGSPLRYLLHPNGQPYPLFNVPAELRVASSGFLSGGTSLLRYSRPPDLDVDASTDDDDSDSGEDFPGI